MTDEACLEISDVSYAYGAKAALKEVTFTVRRGRFTALLGPNGAGKSTLVALVSALIVPRQGEMTVLGHPLGRDSRPALAEMGIVFQQQTLDLDLTVRQNMVYFAKLHGLSGKDAGAGIDSCLAYMGLAGREGEKVRALNGGHRRRLEIARALLHQPRFLLLDEPTVGLDIPTRSELVKHVHALCAERDMVVLWATHLVDEVWPEDDLVILHEGRVRELGPVSEVLARCGAPDVFSAFTGLTQSGGPASDQSEADRP